MSHHRDVCEKHGTVLGQCRCPGPKPDTKKPCPGPPICPDDSVVQIEPGDIRYCQQFESGEVHAPHEYTYEYDRPENLGGHTKGSYFCEGIAGDEEEIPEGFAPPMDPLTSEEIDQLAIDIITNKTFFAWSDEDIRCAFMVLTAFLEPAKVPSNILTMYEDYSKAGTGRAMNGRPIFFSAKMFPKESLEDLKIALDNKAEALGMKRD